MNFSCHPESVLKKKMNPVFMEVNLIVLFPLLFINLSDLPPLSKANLPISIGTKYITFKLIVLGFNNKSTLVGHFVSSSRERETRDRRDSRGDEIETWEK